MPAIIATSQETERHIGRQLRTARRFADMSQTDLANAAGVTYQQVQKYERGNNRIAASRLWALAKALDVPMSYFFEGLA